jgi:hypothetical protein
MSSIVKAHEKQEAEDSGYEKAMQTAFGYIIFLCKVEIDVIKQEVEAAASEYGVDEDELLQQILKDGF